MKNNALILIQKYTDEDCLFCQKYGRLAADKISFAPLLNRVYKLDFLARHYTPSTPN